jgi:hypothetical protein
MELFLFFFIFMFITVSLGIVLSEKSILIKENALFYNKISTSYFIGMTFYVVILRSYYFIFKNLILSNILIILTVFIILALKKKNLLKFFLKYKVFFSFKKIIINFLIIILLSFFVFSVWFDHKYYDPFMNSTGSLHSGKYAWLSNFINTCNLIPTLGQNTGQSILTYFTGFIFNDPKPHLYLYLWLIFALYFLSIYFFSFLREYFFLKKNISLLGVFFIMFGGTALSFTHILVIDSGSPFILNGYSDTLFGVFSVIVAYNIFVNIKEGKKLLVTDIFLISLLLGGNFFMAPQNIIFFLGCLPFFLFDNSIKLNLRKKFLVIFFISLVYFVPQGGMLTPSLFQDNIKSAGVYSFFSKINTNEHKEFLQRTNSIREGITFFPGYPFFYDGIQAWKPGQQSLLKEANSLLKEALSTKENLTENFSSFIWIIEKIFINSIIVLFFPILGLVLIVYWQQMLKKNSNKFYKKRRVIFLSNYTILTFVFGAGFAFFFSFNGYKWELSRFMIPFITFGMISYFIALSNLLKFRKIILFLIFFSVTGPLFSQGLRSQKNILNIHQEKINLFLSPGQKESKSICLKN